MVRPIEMSEPLYICPECRVGHLQSGTAFYGLWVGETFLTIPDFPAWICDVCGAREYDHLALHDLRATLGASAPGRPSDQPDRQASDDAGSLRQSGRPE